MRSERGPAIVITARHESNKRANRWGSLAPLVDRSFLRQVVEYVLDQGFKEINFVPGPECESGRSELGDGVAYGGTFRYYTSDMSPFGRGTEDPGLKILLAVADRLPMLRVDDELLVPDSTLFHWRDGDCLRWTGWGIVNSADLALVPTLADEDELYRYLSPHARTAEVAPPLTARSYSGLIDSNGRALAGEHPGVKPTGREVQPGLWMGRNVYVHRTAKLISPAFLGENCRVGAMTQIGPSAVIGRNCLIGRSTLIRDSVVCEGSYVGERLDLRRVVVNKSTLINARLDAEIEGVDELVLGTAFASLSGWFRDLSHSFRGNAPERRIAAAGGHATGGRTPAKKIR